MVKDIYKWIFGPKGRAAIATPGAALDVSAEEDGTLPPELVEFASAIDKTMLPILGANTLEGPPAHAAASQLGGRPWWPRGMTYPTDTRGKPLYLLAQFNFGEAPAMAPFPSTGLLQVFIGADELYGANFDNLLKPTGFHCVYHADLSVPCDTTSGPTSAPDDEGLLLPLEQPMSAIALSLTLDRMPVDINDHRFEALLPVIAEDETLAEAYCDWTSTEAAGNYAIRLGGYPTFTQDDPRRFGSTPQIGSYSLLTIDTTDGIMWGDCGAAQFFITPSDLRARNFSRVVYNWDCC